MARYITDILGIATSKKIKKLKGMAKDWKMALHRKSHSIYLCSKLPKIPTPKFYSGS